MTVKATPRPNGKWMVTIRFRWPDKSVFRDRPVIDARSKADAERWGLQRESEIRAMGQAAIVTEKAVASGSNITVTDWYTAYHLAAEAGTVGRRNKGKPQTTVADRRIRFRVWIEPHIGHLPLVAVTADHLRALVNMLDDQVRMRIKFYEGEVEREERQGKLRKAGLSDKSAAHVWSEVTSGFREALSSKHNELRVLTVDVTRGVQPPISGEEREQEALFPSEVLALLKCEEIPVARRQCYAVAIYTGLRLSELDRLTAADLDFEHDRIAVRGTKTAAARRHVPIEKALRPLLVRLCNARKTGRLLDVPCGQGEHGAAALVRDDLERAHITRTDLTADTASIQPFTFHGLRHTCITHWAVAGRDQLFLLTCAGHMGIEMTKRYLGKAASVSSKFGTPHAPLPPSLLGGAIVIAIGARSVS